MMENTEINIAVKKLILLHADYSLVEAVKIAPNWQKFWDSHNKGSDMLWLLGNLKNTKKDKNRKKIILIICECARLVLDCFPEKEKRPLKAIEMLEDWAKGLTSMSQIEKIKDDIWDLIQFNENVGNNFKFIYYAYESIAHALCAPFSENKAFTFALSRVASDAAYANAACESYLNYEISSDVFNQYILSQTRKACADIVRKHYPKAPVLLKV